MANTEWLGNYSPNVKKSGYATDQFLGINKYETSGLTAQSDDNPRFAYPGGTIPNIYDAPNNIKTDTAVQRGFIRGIFPEVMERASVASPKYKGVQTPTRRCFFQFNPSLILRSVQASSTTLNPLLQSPTELLQPIPGQASFEFQLLFNREREVSNQEYRTANGMSPTTTLDQSLAAYGSNPSYAQSHVGDLGVLTDLYVLDSIIGQSITSDTISTIQNYWDITKNARGTKASDGTKAQESVVNNADGGKTVTKTNTDGSTVVTTTDSKGKVTSTTTTPSDNPYADIDFTGADFAAKIKQVIGNSAFLNPLPIRIVFSSLFMVEGFVTASNVAFHKFSKNMIPTVCSVTLNVQALYIGFAKKDSYVSTQLEEQINQTIKEQLETDKNRQAAIDFLKSSVYVRLGSVGSSVEGYQSTVGPTLNKAVEKAVNESKDFYFRSKIGFNPIYNGLSIWVNTLGWSSPNANKSIINELKIKEITLTFIDKNYLSESLKSSAKLKAAAETGNLNPGYTNLSVTAVNNNDLRTNGIVAKFNIFNNSSHDKLDLPSADIINKTSAKPYISEWESSKVSFAGTTLGALDKSKIFGNNCAIVMTVSMSCTYKDALGNSQETDTISRSNVLYSFDPNSESQQTRLEINPTEKDAITFTLSSDLAVSKNKPSTKSANNKVVKPQTKLVRLPNGRKIPKKVLNR